MNVAHVSQPHLTTTYRGAQAQRRKRFFRKKVVPWLFAMPTLVISLVVVLGPAVSSVYYSMTEWSGVGAAEFTGLENYQRLFFEDRSFRRAFLNNVTYTVIFLTVPMIMALAGASLLAPLRKAAMLYRIGLFIPYVLPSVITAFIWTQLMDPKRGLGAQLASFGIPGLNQPFLGKPNTVLPAIAFIDNWHWWGFLMVLFLAGMQAIPADLYEAARIDGAGYLETLRRIALPLSLPGVITVMIFNITAWWNDLLIPLVFIGQEERTTVTAAAATLGSRFNMDYPLVLTGLFLASLPPIAAYVVLQRYIRRGLVLGAVK